MEPERRAGGWWIESEAASSEDAGCTVAKRIVMKSLIVFLVATSFAFAAAPVEPKGCLKGAVVGGLAGHYAAHHGWLGAAAGCLYGRHRAKQQERQQQTQHQGQVTDTGPTGM